MEENTQLPKEVVKDIAYKSDEVYNELNALAVEADVDNYGLPTFNKVKEPIEKALTAYATKLHQANETIKVLEYDNNRLKGEVEEEKRQHELSVKSLRYSLDQREAKLNDANKLLNEVFRKHESGLLPDRFIYEKIKTFLYGE